MTDIKENMFFFEGSHQRKLLAFLHCPKKKPKITGIVFCHPFAEEKNCSHAVIVSAARAFAALGFPILRFDFSGVGDSEGDFEDASIEDWLVDIEKAITVFKAQMALEEFALWGLRCGSSLALSITSNNLQPKFMMLWQPVGFREYLLQFLRQTVGAQLTGSRMSEKTVQHVVSQLEQGKCVEIGGYPIAPSMYHSFMKFNELSSNVLPACPLFVTSISMMDSAPRSIAQSVEKLKEKANELKFSHIRAEPFWDRYWRWDCPELIQQSSEWLAAQG